MRSRSLEGSPAPTELEIVAEDGVKLAGRVYAPPGISRGVVLVHAATAVPQAYYRRFAEFLAQQGMRVVTYDYRGVGASRPRSLRGFDATMTDWARLDARAAHNVVRHHWGHEPLALVGHSFGAQLLGLIDEPRDAVGMLIAASQLPYIGHFDTVGRAKIRLLWGALLPVFGATLGYLPTWAGLGEELPMGAAREWGEWLHHPGYLRGFHADAAARFARFDAPTLFYSFTDDFFAPPGSVTALTAALSGAPLDHRRLSPELLGAPIGHFGFFRPQQRALWEESAEWLRAVLAGKPLPERRVGVLITEEDIRIGLGIRHF